MSKLNNFCWLAFTDEDVSISIHYGGAEGALILFSVLGYCMASCS